MSDYLSRLSRHQNDEDEQNPESYFDDEASQHALTKAPSITSTEQENNHDLGDDGIFPDDVDFKAWNSNQAGPQEVMTPEADQAARVEENSPEALVVMLFHQALHQGLHEKSSKSLKTWFDETIERYAQLGQPLDDDVRENCFNNLLARIQNLKLNNEELEKVEDFDDSLEDDSPVAEAKDKVSGLLLERIDAAAAAKLEREELSEQIRAVVGELLSELNLQLNRSEQDRLLSELLHDMLGFGPLEPLLADDDVTDIMVNGADQIYVERKGKLELSEIQFRDDAHVMNIATRIVTKIGRRIDETSPLCDARLPDGSRVNIIIPPLALDGPSISIRKFPKHRITLDVMARQGNISEAMATVLKIAARSRLNILISGGTGSGKTTSLNALSQMIDAGERIVTIEDAAELQLQQPHVVRLETRPPNLEGDGEITMRDLVKNSLRMRPDRVILGEIRGAEAVDMLQAMNTGHDGSLCTIHANNPREALTRLENMVGMAGINLPAKAVKTQIASAVDLIIQVSRMRDGMRRITYVTEIVGMEGDVVTTQDLFKFEFEGEGDDGKLYGRFKSTGLRPAFIEKANYFGLERALLAAMEGEAE